MKTIRKIDQKQKKLCLAQKHIYVKHFLNIDYNKSYLIC